MKISKLIILIIISCIIVGVIGCNEKSSYEKEENKYVMKNPTISADDYWGQEMFQNIEFDTSGENINISEIKRTYSLEDEYVSAELVCNKVGVGFYFYGLPAIEKEENGVWVRLAYKNSDPAREQWCICAVEDAESINFSTNVNVRFDSLCDNLSEGNYRMVVFLTDRIIYMPFEVVGESK